MLGAMGQQAGAAQASLRASLNPISRFDFGILTGMDHAREWQAR